MLGRQGRYGNAVQGGNKEAAYLNVMNGNLVLQDGDDFLAAHGVNPAVSRIYSSQGAYNDSNNGCVVRTEDLGVARQRYAYTAAGRQIRITTSNDAAVGDPGNGASTLTRYDLGGNIVSTETGVAACYESQS